MRSVEAGAVLLPAVLRDPEAGWGRQPGAHGPGGDPS